jgi:hypothetical protein
MSRSFDPATDDDLLPPRERTFHELIADIHTRVFAGVDDAAQDEDLRLFILGRQMLNYTDPEIAAEMVAWGLKAETVARVMMSVSQCGGDDLGDPVERLAGRGTSEYVTTNAAAAAVRRVAERADRRYQLAARMVADQPRLVRADLQFDPPHRSPQGHTARRGRGRLIAVWAAVVVVVALAGGCLWFGLLNR